MSNHKNNIKGIYKIHNADYFGYSKECSQITIFNNETYDYVICGELKHTYLEMWKMIGDTIYFQGSTLGKSVHHSKFLMKGKKLYKIQENGKINDYWIFKKKVNWRVRPT